MSKSFAKHGGPYRATPIDNVRWKHFLLAAWLIGLIAGGLVALALL